MYSTEGIRVFDHANHIGRELIRVMNDEPEWRVNPHSDVDEGADWDSKQITLDVSHKGKWKPAANFMVQQVPGCCAIMTLSYVRYARQVADFAKVTHWVEQAAKQSAFGMLMLTQVVGRKQAKRKDYSLEPWFPLLEQGYVVSEPFMNAKSGNFVVTITKNLGQEVKMAGFETAVDKDSHQYGSQGGMILGMPISALI